VLLQLTCRDGSCQFDSDKSALRRLDRQRKIESGGSDCTCAPAETPNDNGGQEAKSHTLELTCASLATGMKCLPASKVTQANGNVLHDWHAEVLAIRGFNRWILEECAALAQQGREGQGEWVDWTNEDDHDGQAPDPANLRPPFKLKSDVQIHMFCSQAPCGDASMELTMASQQDATPWTNAAPSSKPEDMLGRGHFDRLGVVRRKPARPDAPVTMSKSCSDKLALKQITGLLSGAVAKLMRVDGCYLRTLVMPDSETVGVAVKRAFGSDGRMKALKDWKGSQAGYGFRPFEVRTTRNKFAYSAQGAEAGGSNLSALYTPRRQEILVNGVLQGRKQYDPRGASSASRRGLWRLALEVAVMVGTPAIVKALNQPTYAMAKENANHAREEAKQMAWDKALMGWKRNERDDAWSVEEA
jgi:tRNA-specific adenosine deaminase 1